MSVATGRTSTLPQAIDAVVVGGGPAGLATSRELQMRGIEHLVLERGDRPGFVWGRLYDSLTLHTGRHMSALPGRPLPRTAPLFPPRATFQNYLEDYALHFALPIRTGVEVSAIRRDEQGWVLEVPNAEIRPRAAVMATGIVSNPVVPVVPGRSGFGGQVLHSEGYRRPADIAGKAVLVVGVGNSSGEIASELAAAGRAVDVAVRSGANVMPRTFAGFPIQYLAHWTRGLPRAMREQIAVAVRLICELPRGPSPLPRGTDSVLDVIPLIGFHLVDAIKAGTVRMRPALAAFTEHGARFADGSTASYDAVILATGFRAALGPLGNLVHTDAKGFGRRSDRVASADWPSLWYVGHNYEVTGAIAGIARDAALAADGVRGFLRSG